MAFNDEDISPKILRAVHTLHCLHTIALLHPVMGDVGKRSVQWPLSTGLQLLRVGAYIDHKPFKFLTSDIELVEYRTTCKLFSERIGNIEAVRIYISDIDDGEAALIKEFKENASKLTHAIATAD